jgi:transcriptional regulator with XRE-family HTH domain
MKQTKQIGDELRAVRVAARLSQLELALRIDVSQRHVSFVENGRSLPSKDLLVRWLGELQVPLVDQNRITTEAGFAPRYSNTKLTDPQLAQANQALSYLLEKHEPLPCFVMDHQWNLIQSNRAAQWLIADVLPWLSADKDSAALPATSAAINMLDLLIQTEGLGSKFLNLEQVGPQILAHLRPQSRGDSAVLAKLRVFERLILQRAAAGSVVNRVPREVHPVNPLMTIRLNSSVGELSFFSMFTTFGTPYDITLASIRVEHFFAADRVTLERMTLALAI